MMNQVRRLISSWEVTPYTQFQAADHRGWAYEKMSRQISMMTDYTIAGGPFRGMRYFGPPRIPQIDAVPTTKLLGSYEAELHPWIEALIAKRFHTVVNIGGAEGYYAVGFARRMPDARIVFFDTLVSARKACKALADQNGVKSQMQLRGFCGADALLDIELEGALIVCDCAGAELTLLDPKLYPSMAQSTLLVEIHDYFDPRISPRLQARFGMTHTVEYVTTGDRNPANYRLLADLTAADAALALDERRKFTRDGKPQRWVLLTPLAFELELVL